MAATRTPHVAVVGAGILGATIAHALVREGARVTVLEAHRPGGGTSGTSFAWVNAFTKEPREHFELTRAGMLAWPALADELGVRDAFYQDGSLHWAHEEADREILRRAYERLEAWGYAVERVPIGEARGRWGPALSIPEGVSDVLWCPGDGWLDALPLIGAALRAVAKAPGGTVRYPARVVLLTPTESGVDIELEDGALEADVVVLAAGAEIAEITRAIGWPLRMRSDAGLLVRTRPSVAGLREVVFAPGIHLRPDGGGRLLIGDGDLVRYDPSFHSDRAASRAATLLAAATALVPDLRGTPAEDTRLGVRPVPGDGLPALGWCASGDPIYLVASHSGVSLAAAVAPRVAREIVRGHDVPELVPFRPARLQSART